MSTEDISSKVLCEAWLNGYQELLQELQLSREGEDEKLEEKWYRNTLLRKIIHVQGSTWPLSTYNKSLVACPREEVSMLPSFNIVMRNAQ